VARWQYQELAEPYVPAVVVETSDGGTDGDSGGLDKPKVIQYTSVSGPVSVPSVAATVDGATQGESGVFSESKPLQYAAIVGPAFVASTSQVTAAQGESGSFSRLNRLQYAAIVGPELVPSQFTPATNNSWNADFPDRHIYRRTAQFLAYAAPHFVPDVTQAVTPLSWEGSQPDRHIYRRTPEFRAYSAPNFVPDVTQPVTANSWAPEFPDRHKYLRTPEFRAFNWTHFEATYVATGHEARAIYPSRHNLKHRSATYNQSQAEFGYEVDVPSLSWTGRYLDPPVLSKRRLQTHGSIGPVEFTAPVAPDITPSVYPSRVIKTKYLVALQQALGWSTFTPAEVAALEGAGGTFDATAFYSKVLQYTSVHGPVAVPVAPVAPEGASQGESGSFERAYRLQYAAVVGPGYVPVQAPAFDPATNPSWRGQLPNRPKARYPLSIYLDSQSMFGWEVDVPVMSWTGHYPDRIVRAKRKTHPQGYVSPVDAPAVPPPDFRFPIYPHRLDRIYRRATYVQYQPEFGYEVDVPVMSWTGRYLEPPVRRKARLQGDWYQAPFSYEAATPAPDSSWEPRFPSRVPWRKTLLTGQQLAWVMDRFQAPDVVVPSLTSPVYPSRHTRVYRRATYAQSQPEFGYEVDVPSLSWTGWYLVPPTRRVHSVARNSGASAPIHVPDVTAPVTALSWSPNYPSRIAPKRSLNPAQQRAFQGDTKTTVGTVEFITTPTYPNALRRQTSAPQSFVIAPLIRNYRIDANSGVYLISGASPEVILIWSGGSGLVGRLLLMGVG